MDGSEDDGYELQVRARQRARRRIALGSVAVLFLVAGTWTWDRSVAPDRLAHYKQQAYDCVDRAYLSASQDAQACGVAGAGPWAVEHLSSHGDEVAALRAAVAVAVRRAALRAADCDVEKARAAGEALIGDKGASRALLTAGLLDVLAAHPEIATTSFELETAFDAAVAALNLDAALDLARREVDPEITKTWTFDVKRGALLCLAGAEAAGRAALERADRAHLAVNSTPYDPARLALVACGGSADEVQLRFSFNRGPLAGLLASRGETSRLTALKRVDLGAGRGAGLFVLRTAAGFGDPADIDALRRVLDRDGQLLTRPDAKACLFPASLLTATHRLVLPAERYLRAAEALDERAETIAPIEAGVSTRMLPSRFLRDPASALRAAADGLRHTVAVDALRSGEPDRARQALAAMRPDARCTVPLRLHLGDTPGALRAIDQALGETPSEYEAVALRVVRAQTLAQAERLGDAFAEIEAVFKRGEGPAVGPVAGALTAAAWVRAALALRLERSPDALGLPTPPEELYGAKDGRALLAWLLRLRAASPGDRSTLRRKMIGLLSHAPPEVLAEVFYVTGEALAGDGDIPLFINRLWQGRAPMGGRAAWWARARAAAWRGDRSAAANWHERSGRFLRLSRGLLNAHLADAAGF
jgi:hypothetical protein